MKPSSLPHRLREGAKLTARRGFGRAGLSIGRDPYTHRLVRALDAHGVASVLDVGANVGQYAALLRAAGFEGEIVSVEPLDSAHAVLGARAARDGRWRTVHLGVGASSTTAHLNVSANSYSSSVLDMEAAHLAADPASRVVATQPIALTTVDELIRTHGLDPARCLLKVDTQGYESEVLDGAGGVIDQLTAIQLELSFVSLYSGQHLFDDLVARMRSHGLELWSLDPGISDAEGRLLQCDGLFVRARSRAEG